MLEGIFQTLGGLGLFLLGMIIMTDGLKRLTGRYLRHTLTRFTNSPVSGAATGAISTAILQSSSAMTVAAVGFVGAGLLTFPQALGIIFGANIGTTITGWLVALLGFKLKLGVMVLPLILIGVLLRLFARGQIAASGLSLAGFGLIFVGITQLQLGMEGLQGLVTPESFPDDTWTGRLQLVAIGVGITLVTQSSSAGVAAAITAVYIGTITFPQAAAMVIGMDLGTTVTAVLATIGGGIESRRTGYSHVIYNIFTAIGALLLLTPYVWVWNNLLTINLHQHSEIALVAFHTSFNIIGVMLILPFTSNFAHLMEKVVTGTPSQGVWRLDRLLLQDTPSALQAIRITLSELTIKIFQHLQSQLQLNKKPKTELLTELHGQMTLTHSYIDELHIKPEDNHYWKDLVSSIHAVDHLFRLRERCEEDVERIEIAASDQVLMAYSKILLDAIDNSLVAMKQNDWAKANKQIEEIAAYLRIESPDVRGRLMEDVASGHSDVPYSVDRLEAIRSLRRISQHMSRILFYMQALCDPESHGN